MTEISAKSVPEVQDIIQNYEIESNAKFRVVKKDVRFGSDCKDLSVLIKKVRFRDPQPDSVPIIPSDGTPFVLVGRKLLECHQGIDRDIHRKQKRRNEKQNNGDHDFTRKRRLIQPTKKKDCPVRIRIRHIIKFPGFKVDINSSAYDRDHASAALKTAIEEKKDVISEHRFYIALPDQSEHRNHLRGESFIVNGSGRGVSSFGRGTSKTLVSNNQIEVDIPDDMAENGQFEDFNINEGALYDVHMQSPEHTHSDYRGTKKHK